MSQPKLRSTTQRLASTEKPDAGRIWLWHLWLKSSLIDAVSEIDQGGLRVHAEGCGNELGVHGVHQVEETGAADCPGWVSAAIKDVGEIRS
ncbi:hypothetical protein AB0C96_04410 [Streptomyces sp. NPDC048506]|uniref:hypothetical protein n=1 Tax=Streptomyces sp. NPDC048506 TaxID=3155028 RepID=UPI003425AE89